jgi:hypothetical protein
LQVYNLYSGGYYYGETPQILPALLQIGKPIKTVKGTYTYTKGTGKYEGIQGSGTYQGMMIGKGILSLDVEGEYFIKK